jgi:hypothetical protein
MRVLLLAVCIMVFTSCTSYTDQVAIAAQSQSKSPSISTPPSSAETRLPSPPPNSVPIPNMQIVTPDLTGSQFKAYSGIPPGGTYPDDIARMRPHWTDKGWGSLGAYNEVDAKTPVHFKPGQIPLKELRKIYEDFTHHKYEVGDFCFSEEWINHNVAYTLWSADHNWYIPTLCFYEGRRPGGDVFGRLLLYLSKHRIDNNQYIVTEKDVQTWKMEDLEATVKQHKQQQQY